VEGHCPGYFLDKLAVQGIAIGQDKDVRIGCGGLFVPAMVGRQRGAMRSSGKNGRRRRRDDNWLIEFRIL